MAVRIVMRTVGADPVAPPGEIGEAVGARPRRMTLDVQLQIAGIGPGVEAGSLRSAPAPATRPDGRRRLLARAQRPGQHLQQHLRLGVAAHRAHHRTQRPVGALHDGRGERVRGAPAGSVLRSMAFRQAEADASVVQADPVCRGPQPDAPAPRIGLDQRHAHAVGIHRREVHGVAGTGTGAERRRRIRRDGGAAGCEALGRDQRRAVSVFRQHRGPIPSRLLGSLGQQVGEQRIVGVCGQVQPGGDPGASEREIALRVRRHGPQAVPPSAGLQRRHPVGLGTSQVRRGVLAAAQLDEVSAEIAFVVGLPAAVDDLVQGRSDAGSGDEIARPVLGRVVAGVGDAVEQCRSHCAVGRQREAAACEVDRGGEHLRQRGAPEPFVQAQPPVDASRHRHAANVVAESHPRAALGAQRVGVGAASGPAARIERCGGRAVGVVHQRPQVAAHAAHVLGGHGEHSGCRHRCVCRRAAAAQQRYAGLAREMVDAAHHAAAGVLCGERDLRSGSAHVSNARG